MIVRAKFTFYDINACGYFVHGNDDPRFGNVAETLSQLKCWVTNPGLVLKDTCTYDNDEQTDYLKTYCFDIVRCCVTGDYVLITWNEIPSIEGKTATVNGGEPVGAARIELTELPTGGIPGYATYFWFLPSDSMFATVTINSILNGHPNLVLYLNGFLRSFSDYVCREPNEEGGIEIKGYHQNPNEPVEKLYPRFQSTLRHNRAEIDYIIRNRENIRKYIRKMEVRPHVEQQVSFWRRLFMNATGLDQEMIVSEPVRLRYELSTVPTENELRAMIREWRNSHTTRWDDVGFQLAGDEQNLRWLSHSLARSEFDLDIAGDADPAVSARDLVDAILPQRNRIRSIVREQ